MPGTRSSRRDGCCVVGGGHMHPQIHVQTPPSNDHSGYPELIQSQGKSRTTSCQPSCSESRDGEGGGECQVGRTATPTSLVDSRQWREARPSMIGCPSHQGSSTAATPSGQRCSI